METVEKTFRFSNVHADYQARDAKSVFGWRYNPRIIFKGGKGVKLIDMDGNEYYDMSSGMMCMVLGHSHPELTEVIKEMAGSFIHQSSWYSNPWTVEFAERLTEHAPGKLKVVNFAVTGSEANEIAMRMALAYTGKFDIVSMVRGLHGGSLAVEAMTTVGGNRRKGLGPLLPAAKSNALQPPYCYRCPVNLTYPSCDIACQKFSEEMLEFTTSQDIAGIMVETIPVPGGMIVPPPEWLPRIAAMAKRWGALLILDECQLAPARTGKMWAMEHYGVTPDIVTWGKGLSAGLAICGTITTEEIAERTRGNAGLPWAGTYSSDPMVSAVALKQLDIVIRDDLAGRAARLGELAANELRQAQGQVRMHRRCSRQGPLPYAGHRQGPEIQDARPRHGGAYPLQLRARRDRRHLRQALLPVRAATDHHGSGDQGRRGADGQSPSSAQWMGSLETSMCAKAAHYRSETGRWRLSEQQ